MVRTLIQRWAGLALLAVCMAGCGPSGPQPPGEASPPPDAISTPTPRPATPTPAPTPLVIPYKRLDVGRLFNGAQVTTSFLAEQGGSATHEAAEPDSYRLQLSLTIRVPRAVKTVPELAALNPALPALFPALGRWVETAHVSPLYERLYRHKVNAMQHDLARLDLLLGRHDLFDCETILEFDGTSAAPGGQKRRVLWIQSDMDVDGDGSDADRAPMVDASSPTYQPLTSYKWPKRGANVNPFLAQRSARVLELEKAMAHATEPQRSTLRAAAEAARYEAEQLRKYSFLVAADDPYIVVPGSLWGQRDDPYAPAIGDYCCVVYGTSVYPAIVGDVGPSTKIGEASLRIAQQINPRATSENRPVSPLKVSYLVFPGSAEHPFQPPNLAHWRDRVQAMLQELGGCTAPVFEWMDLTVPPPTPTPSPTVAPSPGATPASTAVPGGSPAGVVVRGGS